MNDLADDDFDGDPEPTLVIQAFAPGAMFGERFVIEGRLGAGGMGDVFTAVDLLSNERVALKVLRRKQMKGDAEERFRREVDILAAANHPGIVAVRSFGHTTDGTLWLAMEHLQGESLRQRVKRKGPMDPRELLPILRNACDALAQAHRRGIIHRDLKPDHLFLPESGEPIVKVLDFGLSISAGSKKLTKTGTVLGTPRYMAPEQIASAHGSDGRADVYALGVIAYEALTGDSPFVASDHGQLLGAILTGKVEPLNARRPDVPVGVVRAIEIAMARTVEHRWQSPLEFSDAFAKGLAGDRLDRYADRARRALTAPAAGDDAQRPSFSSQPTDPGRGSAPSDPAPIELDKPDDDRPTWMEMALLGAGSIVLVLAGAAVTFFILHGR
jgi:serine/threonine protein kinase